MPVRETSISVHRRTYESLASRSEGDLRLATARPGSGGVWVMMPLRNHTGWGAPSAPEVDAGVPGSAMNRGGTGCAPAGAPTNASTSRPGVNSYRPMATEAKAPLAAPTTSGPASAAASRQRCSLLFLSGSCSRTIWRSSSARNASTAPGGHWPTARRPFSAGRTSGSGRCGVVNPTRTWPSVGRSSSSSAAGVYVRSAAALRCRSRKRRSVGLAVSSMARS